MYSNCLGSVTRQKWTPFKGFAYKYDIMLTLNLYFISLASFCDTFGHNYMFNNNQLSKLAELNIGGCVGLLSLCFSSLPFSLAELK